MTFVGRFAVLVMICIGVVLIPVQAGQVYNQLQARRVTLGRHFWPDNMTHSGEQG